VVSYDNGQYTLRVDNVTKDMTVNIVMGLYINLTGVDNVTTTPNNIENKILVAYNTNQNIILNANENYVLTSVKVDNVEMLSNGVSRYVASFDRVVAEHNLDVVATRLYSVTASITNGTIASQNSTIQVQSGSDTTIVFSINENYSLSEIKINGEEIATKDNSNLTYDSNLQQYTLKLTNVTEDKNVVIVATLNKVKVNLVVGSNGSVKIGENTYTNESVELELDYGTNLTFVVKPNSEYEIDSIIYNGEAQNTTISAIANITNSENTLSVSFKLVKYIVQVTAGDNNVTLVSSASQEVNSGDDVKIEFRINNHYHYDSIKVNGVVYTGQVVNNAGVYSFTIAEVNKNQTIQIFSAIDAFSVGVATFTNGAVSPNSSVNVAYGNSQAFTFTPSTGYELLEENIVITNTDSDTMLTSGWTFVNNVLTISTIESNIEISVTMTKAKVYYNVNMVSNSIVTPINPISITKVEEGTNYTFEFELKENYEVTSIQMNTTLFQGSIEENDGVYSFTYEINEDTVVTINTALVKHTVTVTVGDNGSVSPNTNVLVSHGSNQSFVITPDSGYDIDTILLNGVRQSVTGNTYSINNVTEDMTLSITFKEKLAQYEISITLYNGTLVNGSQNKTTVTRGDNLVLNFKSESYYHLQSIVVDGENVSIDVAENDSLALSGGVYSYTFNNVTSNHTVSVTFKLNTVDIAINITGDGSVSPKVSGNVYTMDYGTSQSFTFTALAGYTLSSVNVDGAEETLSSDTTHTVSLDNVTENHTIDVVFTALPNVYVVNVSSNTTGGSITSGNGRNAVTSGDSLDIYVTVDKANEYIIESVNVDGINLDLNDNTVITDNGNGEYVIHILNVNSNKSVMVMFGLKKYAIDITYNANGVVYYSENVVASGNSVQATYTNNLTLQVYANEGYELLLSGITTGVEYNTGSGMYYTYSGNLITIYNVNSTASFAFNFTEKPVYYDVTVSSDSNVTIISDVDASILKNENLVVKFRVSDNYLVSTLLINNVAKNVEDYITHNAQDNTYTLSISVVENINVSIATELVKYNITITNDGNGVVHIGETAYNTNGVAKVSHGTNVNISVVPNADYEIATILLDGEEVEITNKQSQLVMITACSGEHTLSVTYARVIVYYTVNVSSGLGGSVTNSGKNQVQENSEFSVTITPNENYELVSVLVDGEEIDIDTELEITGSSYVYTINNVSANVDIRATFAKVKYDVTINVGDNGSTSVNGTIYTGANNVLAVEYGTNLEFAFTASEGYRLNTFKVDGTNAELTNNTYTLTNVMVAHTIDITFEKVEYTITITGGENGSVETNRITVLHGEDADFDITPNEGYTVSGVYVDGVKDSANLENNNTYYTFKLDNVVASHSVEVVFTIKTLNISVSTIGEGSVDVSTIAVNYGSTKTIYIYPATNNHLLNVLDNGTSVIDIVELGLGGAYSYTISNIVVSHEISVVFELDKVE
ncbi:MAG: hypothetical protein IJW28_05950, partial [Clostridia bacterium]|nr:hypothetical protein [Clostridia bacterium]